MKPMPTSTLRAGAGQTSAHLSRQSYTRSKRGTRLPSVAASAQLARAFPLCDLP